MKKFLLSVLVLCSAAASAFAQTLLEPNPKLLNEKWQAHWITCPDASVYDYGVYHFRKSFDLPARPGSFIVNVSADNRYRLFVNGEPVCRGPARGDPAHWYYETVDIGPYLREGKNTIAAVVWNFGEYTAGPQMTLKTGFIMQANSDAEKVVNTDSSWKVVRNEAYSPSLENRHDVGCSDIVDAGKYPWGWETAGYDDSSWKPARVLSGGTPYGTNDGYAWVMRPRDIPFLEEVEQNFSKVRRAENIEVPEGFLEGKVPLEIPANTKASVLFDQGVLTTAYPELVVSGGKGGNIRLSYAEALFKDGQKGNRDDVEGRDMDGAYYDRFYTDGGADRRLGPLYFKTWRYLKMDVETAEEPMVIKDFHSKFVGYPFRENGYFGSDRESIAKIWEVGWRTARLCAHETYYDCPYYEQLQYVGDTRIQALISLYVSGDDRLMRKAIRCFDWSRSGEGITGSRYPSRTPQYIPPFSLYWINMVHDYWMHRDDEKFVLECLPGVKTVLEWYADKVDPGTGMLGHVPHWNFTDWTDEWPWNPYAPVSTGGMPPGGIGGGSSILTLQLAYTLKDAVELFEAFGEDALAQKYSDIYESLVKNTLEKCWDEDRGLFFDDIGRTSYSQHANIMGILSDAVPAERQKEVFEKLDSDPTLIQATFYYRFYLFRAMKKAGLGDMYVGMLKPWHDMIDMGLTTFAEKPEPTRSDCHAWSASPLYDLLATVAGVEPAEPGFKSVKIEPHLGDLKHVEAHVPHPKGLIKVKFDKNEGSGGIDARIFMPTGLSGTLILNGEEIPLKEGQTEHRIPKANLSGKEGNSAAE